MCPSPSFSIKIALSHLISSQSTSLSFSLHVFLRISSLSLSEIGSVQNTDDVSVTSCISIYASHFVICSEMYLITFHTLAPEKSLLFDITMSSEKLANCRVALHGMATLKNRRSIPGKPYHYIYDALFSCADPSLVDEDGIGSFRHFVGRDDSIKQDGTYNVFAKVNNHLLTRRLHLFSFCACSDRRLSSRPQRYHR